MDRVCSPIPNDFTLDVPLGNGDLIVIADALGFLAGIDEGEHVDTENLNRLERLLRDRLAAW